jgi:hypothetical protein
MYHCVSPVLRIVLFNICLAFYLFLLVSTRIMLPQWTVPLRCTGAEKAWVYFKCSNSVHKLAAGVLSNHAPSPTVKLWLALFVNTRFPPNWLPAVNEASANPQGIKLSHFWHFRVPSTSGFAGESNPNNLMLFSTIPLLRITEVRLRDFCLRLCRQN